MGGRSLAESRRRGNLEEWRLRFMKEEPIFNKKTKRYF